MITEQEARNALDLMRTQPDALIPDGDEGCDYTLQPGRGAWVTVGTLSILITEESISVHQAGHEDKDPLGAIYLFNLEATK